MTQQKSVPTLQIKNIINFRVKVKVKKLLEPDLNLYDLKDVGLT